MSIKQNFDTECEAMINKQINMELYASYVYLSMTAFFSRFKTFICYVLALNHLDTLYHHRDDVALNGFVKRFKHASDEEREHAQKLINYQVNS